jgi:hypothetical protein
VGELLAIVILIVCPLGVVALIAAGRVAHHPAWRALHVTVLSLLFMSLTYLYLGAMGGNQSMRALLDGLWSWNLLSGDSGYFPLPARYEPLGRHILLYWAWVCPPLLLASVVLAFLEYLDSKSGLEIAERVKKLVWK